MPSENDDPSREDLEDKAKEARQDFDQFKQSYAGNGPPSPESLTEATYDPLLKKVSSYWWVLLVTGIFWVVIAIVVLKFNHASVTTVGILIGLMLLVFAAQNWLIASLDKGARWLWVIFAILLTAGGIVALIHPRKTFAGFADILGFIFVVIGVLWMIQAFAERPINNVWWLTLIAGILMIALAFWVSGQYFLTRAYTLLIFAGIWALSTGVIDIVRAFQLKALGDKGGERAGGFGQTQVSQR